MKVIVNNSAFETSYACQMNYYPQYNMFYFVDAGVMAAYSTDREYLFEQRDLDIVRAFLAGNKAAFPDYREDLEMLVAEGDLVAWRSVGTGTQLGPMGPFPPTGRRMTITIIGMHRFENGRIAETWTSWDNLAALTQLGLMPA